MRKTQRNLRSGTFILVSLFGPEGSVRDFQKITFLVPVRCEEGQGSDGRSYWCISTKRDEALTKQVTAIKVSADLEN